MDENGKKVLPGKFSQLPQNRIFPETIETETQQLNEDEGSNSDAPKFDDLKGGTQRSEQGLNDIEPVMPSVTEQNEKSIEGKVQIWDEKVNKKTDAYIQIKKEKISLYDECSNELLHELAFPHDAEYRFVVSEEQKMIITDKKGYQIKMIIQENQLYEDILMEWYGKKFFSDFEKMPEKKCTNDFDEINYSFTFSILSSKEFGNVYNERCMNAFQFYQNVEEMTPIKNATDSDQDSYYGSVEEKTRKLSISKNTVDVKYFYRPNRTTESIEYLEIEKLMKNRQFIDWAPSRDWSRLFVLQTEKEKSSDKQNVFLEFYDFNLDQKNIQSFPKRINCLSQLLRPKKIENIYSSEQIDTNILIETSFKCDRIAIRFPNENNKGSILYYYNINPDQTIGRKVELKIYDSIIDSFSFIGPNFIVFESKKIYYQYDLYDEQQDRIHSIEDCNRPYDKWNPTYFCAFSQTDIQNIINCGVYDILIFEKQAKIFNNIDSRMNREDLFKQLDDIVVNDEILQLLKSQKFIQLDDHSIACLHKSADNYRIRIIDINSIYLTEKDSYKIELQSPYKDITNCLFELLKQLDIREDQCQILNQDQDNVYPQKFFDIQSGKFTYQKLEVYNKTFQKNLFRFIESKEKIVEEDIQSDKVQKIVEEDIQSNYEEKIVKEDIQSENKIYSIEIPESFTSVQIREDSANSRILIFQPSLNSIKHVILKQLMTYITHQVIYRDSYCFASIILSTKKNHFYELRISFDLTGATIAPLKSIMKLKKAHFLHYHHFSNDLTLSMLINNDDQNEFYGGNVCYFTQYSCDSTNNKWSEKEESIKFKLDGFIHSTKPQMAQIIQRLASSQSLSLESLIIDSFEQILDLQDREGKMIFGFLNKIIIFSAEKIEEIKIFDDTFTEISKVSLKSKIPIQRIVSVMNSGVIECTDLLNNKFPFPILGNSLEYDSKSQENFLKKYSKNFRYPSPVQFAQLDGFISHLDLDSQQLQFYLPEQGISGGNPQARIEISVEKESFIDKIKASKLKTEIMNLMNADQIQINSLLSYNLNKRENLIIGTQEHDEKELIYSQLYKRLYLEDINDLPLLIYNTSLDSNKYETVLDVLIKNKAIKLAQLIVGISITQDKIGYLQNRLGPYLSILSANELQLLIESPIFFFKIPSDSFDEYQILEKTLVRPYSKYNNFPEIKKNMKEIERKMLQRIEEAEENLDEQNNSSQSKDRKMEQKEKVKLDVQNESYQPEDELQEEKEAEKAKENKDDLMDSCQQEEDQEEGIEEDKANENCEEKKDSYQDEEGKAKDNIQNSERENHVLIEYFAINLMQLMKSNHQPILVNHREVTNTLCQLIETDPTILEKESIQIIIDFKWQSYAWNFFAAQMFLYICFIITFIIDIVAVSKNAHVFQNNDPNQVIPRIFSIIILFPFAIYETANIKVELERQFYNFWSINDMLLIFVYALYFTISFAQPDQEYLLKTLQLIVVVLSFIKFIFLIRIQTNVSFLVKMLLDVFNSLIIFLLFFLIVTGGLTVMAQIIIKESGDQYDGIKLAAFFLIVLRQSIGDYDTASIVEGTQDFKILAWLLWLLILIIGNIVFMNFIIAVVSESYESCMEKKTQLIYRAKLEMIEECENLMPERFLSKQNWFPRFIIIRRQQGSSSGGDNTDEWQGFVKQMKRHLENEHSKLNGNFIQTIKRSTDSTQKEMKAQLKELKNDAVDIFEIKRDISEIKKDLAEVKVIKEQMNKFEQILAVVYKDQLAANNANEGKAKKDEAE